MSGDPTKMQPDSKKTGATPAFSFGPNLFRDQYRATTGPPHL